MTGQLLIALLGTAGFALGAIAAYLHLRHRTSWAPLLLRAAVLLALAINLLFIITDVRRHGPTDAFRRNFDSTLLLATLIGLAGIGTHLSPTLRGLDGFLFIGATLAQLASLTVLHRPDMEVTRRAWFISHPVAFAVSGTFFIAGGVAGVAYLLVDRMLRRKPTSRLVGSVASLESLERYGRWMPAIGFPLFTYGILTGFCGVWHRADIGQTAWYLDPSFLFSIVAWGVYAYLFYGLMYRPSFRGRRAATLATYGLGLIVTAFLLREFLSPMHR